ncbi:acyl-CoA N-acyltransferase [Leucogyrophana mollusca]|uniref:Acyl-CoA N-acyltransferase n=1 Tax=Leucogyrophana mollusca TaxID=85980 RepID=A0ACB8BUD3_9AGAM|nr:acyl-CoA N-acyltransferase [Leucogyrophana mollusca]
MIGIRTARADDATQMQSCGLQSLPEDELAGPWAESIMAWPSVSTLAEDEDERIVGYALGVIKGPAGSEGGVHGPIRSLSVLNSHRRQGLARRLLASTLGAMVDAYGASHATLRVRKSNGAARALYESLGFVILEETDYFYADGESCIMMIAPLEEFRRG